jgi:hypothetical protein
LASTVACTVVFLILDHVSYLMGHGFVVDGGLSSIA